MSDKIPELAPVNRYAVVSMIAALLTVLSFCIAVAPIPLTGWVCYPSAAVFGLVSLITGIISLAQISRTAENGRSYAVMGSTVGTLAILGSACAVAAGIAFFPRLIAFLGEGFHRAEAMGQRITQFILSLRSDFFR